MAAACVGVSPAWLRRILARKLQQPLQVVDDRIERTVLVIGRAAKLNAGRSLVRKLLFEFLHQPGFANPRLTAEQHHLAFTRFGLLPAPLQQPQFFGSRPPAASSLFAPPPQSDSAPHLPANSIHRQRAEMPLSVWGPRSWHSNKPCTR